MKNKNWGRKGKGNGFVSGGLHTPWPYVPPPTLMLMGLLILRLGASAMFSPFCLIKLLLLFISSPAWQKWGKWCPCSEGYHNYVAEQVALFNKKNKRNFCTLFHHLSKVQTIQYTDKSEDDVENKSYGPLYEAILKNDWKRAETFLEKCEEGLTAALSLPDERTALSVAAMEGHSDIVEKLVDRMDEKSLAEPDKSRYTALIYAAVDGNLKSVRAILKKDPTLAQYEIKSNTKEGEGGVCILAAALSFSDGQEKMPNKKKPKIKKICWLLSVFTKEEHALLPKQNEEHASRSKKKEEHAPRLKKERRRTSLADKKQKRTKKKEEHANSLFELKEEHANCSLFELLLGAGYFDICLYLLNRYPEILSNFDNIAFVIKRLIPLCSQFRSGSKMGFWEAFVYNLVPINTRHTPRHWLKEEVEKLIPNSESLLRIQSNSSSRVGVISQVIYWIRRLIWKIVASLVPSLKYIRYKKKKHMYADALTEYLLKQLAQMKYTESEILTLRKRIEYASYVGSVEVIKAFYKFLPDMLWSFTPYVIKNAIDRRHDQIFSLFNDINGRNKLLFMRIARTPNICFSAAELSPDPKLLSVSGAAFQIQRELQWFEEVNKLMAPFIKNPKKKETTAWEVFMQEHKDLREEAEQWMKDTSNYCMVVAALIATVAFAAAFTVPGGNNGDNGVPIYIKSNSFLVFAIFNALALFSSITSIVMFLSILTSRFEMEDFIRSLPERIIMGLSSLFFCLASMLVAFGAGLSVVLKDRWRGSYIPITVLASFPGLMFVILQLPLFVNMIQSTYGRGVFHPKKIW